MKTNLVGKTIGYDEWHALLTAGKTPVQYYHEAISQVRGRSVRITVPLTVAP